MSKKNNEHKKDKELSSKTKDVKSNAIYNTKDLEEELKKDIKIYEDLEKLEKENENLKKQLEEQEDILKNTQLQYISLKNEFDSFSHRVKKNEEKQKEDIFEKIILKMLPIIELFLSSYELLPEEFKWNKWTEWLDIINKKINSFLNESNMEVIKTIWEDPDETKHEILGMEPVKSKKKKNKIIKEVKKWYILKKDGKEKILEPAKVIVWI